MRRITFMIMSTVGAVILLFSYRTSTQGPGSGTAASGAGAPGIVSGAAVAPSPSATKSGATSTTPAQNVTVNGTTAETRWGPVQVQVKISGGKIVDVQALQQPDGNDRDQEINSYAIPQLRDEVLQAQSAKIDGVSGATVTSGGYIESLQAALDTAHFG